MMIWESMDLGYLRPRITTISESMSLTEWLKKGSTGESRQNESKSSARSVSRNYGWSCKSMEIYKSQPERKYAPVWHQMCGRWKKSDGTKSSITKCVILIIHVHSWIGPIDQRNVSQKEKHDDIQMLKSVSLTEWLKRDSLEDHDKITNRSLSRRISCKWGWLGKSMEIYKSQPKRKYAPVWHKCMVDWKIRQHWIIYH